MICGLPANPTFPRKGHIVMNYYNVHTEVDVLRANNDIPGGDEVLPGVSSISYVGSLTTRDPLDEEAASLHDFLPDLIEATPEEVQRWRREHDSAMNILAGVNDAVRTARKEFERTLQALQQQRQAVWGVLGPISTEIDRRRQLVEDARNAAGEKNRLEDDAELGPPVFYVTRPSHSGQEGPEMDVPTVHHVDCAIAGSIAALPAAVRAGEAFLKLMRGGIRQSKIGNFWQVDDPWADRLPGVACDQCRAFAMMRAESPEDFDARSS